MIGFTWQTATFQNDDHVDIRFSTLTVGRETRTNFNDIVTREKKNQEQKEDLPHNKTTSDALYTAFFFSSKDI